MCLGVNLAQTYKGIGLSHDKPCLKIPLLSLTVIYKGSLYDSSYSNDSGGLDSL